MQLLTKKKKKNNNKKTNSCGVIVTLPSFGWETPGASPGKSVSYLLLKQIHHLESIYIHLLYNQDFKIYNAYVIKNLKRLNV